MTGLVLVVNMAKMARLVVAKVMKIMGLAVVVNLVKMTG